MPTIDQFRALIPNGDKLSDYDIVKEVSRTLEMDPRYIADRLGFETNKPGFISDVKRGTGQVIEALGSTAQDLGLSGVGKAAESYGAGLAFQNPSQINTVEEAIRNPWTTTREAVGEVAPQVGASIGAGLVGRVVGGALGLPFGPGGVAVGQTLGAGAGAYLGNLAQEYGGIRSEQRQQGIEDKGLALATGGAAAVLDTALGAERIANKFLAKGSDILAREAGTSLGKHVGKQAAIGTAIEAGTEGVQTGLERIGAYKDLTSPEALNEIGLSMIKGGIGGGVIRGGLSAVAGERQPEGGSLLGGTSQQSNSDIQQSFTQSDISATPITTEAPASSAPINAAPAVSGGTTDIAQSQQQAAAENQAVQMAQRQQAAREDTFQKIGAVYNPEGQGSLSIFGQTVLGPQIGTFGNALATKVAALPPHAVQIANAIAQANTTFATADKPSPLVSFTYNGNNPIGSADKVLKALEKVTEKYQIGHVASEEEAANNLNTISKTAKGADLEKLNAIYEALTGKDTDGFIASQESKAAKEGAKNGKLQLQTTAGVGTVPVQGGAGEAAGSNVRNVQPGGVQPVGAGSLAEGSLGLQVGQPSGEGIRAGTSTVPGVVGTQLLGTGQGQGALSDQLQATAQDAAPNAGERPADAGTEATASAMQGQPASEPAVEESQVEAIPDLIRNALLKKYKSAQKIDLLFYLSEPQNRGDYAKLAEDNKLSLAYIKELANLAKTRDGDPYPKFVMDVRDDFLQGVNDGAKESGISLLDALDALDTISNAYAEGGPLGTEVNEADMSSAGLSIQNREERTDKEGKGTGKSDLTNVTNIVDEADYRDRASEAYLAELDVYAEDPSEENKARLDAAERAASATNKSQAQKLFQAYQKIKEGKNAVQEPSAEKVPVREGTAGGEAVGEGNAKRGKATRVRKVQAEPKQEAKPQEVATPEVQTPAEQWNALIALTPELPPYETLARAEKDRWDDLAHRGTGNLAAAVRIIGESTQPVGTALAKQGAPAEGTNRAAAALTDESNVIDVEARIIKETIAPKVAALPAPQIDRLEKFYGLKRDTEEFLARVKEDVVTFATKGAEAVSAAIRDIIKAVHSGVLAVAMIFNPMQLSVPSNYVIVPAAETVTTQREVKAELPSDVVGMSPAGQQAYATLIPAMKGKNGDKLITIVDKPSGRTYVFDADGKLIVQKKTLQGAAYGDLYKGNNDLPQNRITPAGLFGLKLVDASKGGSAAKTAGEYDFGKVFAFEDPDAVVTIMHSVWLHEKDAPQRAAALKNTNAADSRYSFGCINVDKDTYKMLLDKYEAQMDGSTLFVVPDDQSKVKDFLEGNVPYDKMVRKSVKPVTETVTTTRKNASGTQEINRAQVGKEETGPLASKSKAFYDVGDLADAFDGVAAAQNQLEDLGIEHAMEYVSDWQIINDASDDAINGEIRSGGGRYTIVLNEAKLTSSKHATETVTHEVAHAVDMAPHGGIYSSQAEMSVTVKDGKITPVGVVAREMFNLYNTRDNWREYLEYPFDTTKFPDLNNSTLVEGELFAQVFSAYADPKARAALEELAPKTAAFMAEVIKHVQSTRSLQIQKPETVAVRSLAFRNRNASQRGEASVTAIPRRETESLASRSQALGPEPLRDRLPKPLQSLNDKITTDLLYQVKKGVLASAITEDVVNMATKYMRSAADYLKAQYDRQALRLQHELKVEKILQQYDKLPKELQGTGKGSVNEFIFDSTTNGLWGYYPGEQFVGTTLLNVDKGMKARFDAFPPIAQKLIRDVFGYGNEALRAKQKAVKDAIDREFADRENAALGDADALDKIAKDKAKLMQRESRLNNLVNSKPYAYLGRYGDFVMVAKSKEYKEYESRWEDSKFTDPAARDWLDQHETDSAHYVVEFAETLSEARRIANEYSATGLYDWPEAFEKEAYADQVGSADTYVSINRLRKLVSREFKSADPDALKSIDKMLGDLYLITAAESSARKSMLQRKNITGADKDMMRNMATSGRANAHFLATLQYNDAIADSIEKMRQERKYNNEEATPFFNELLKRHASSVKYETPGPLSSFLTKTTSVWFLATSPAFYLQQMLQTYVLSLPYIAGRLGYFRSARAINAAYKDMAGLVKGINLTDHIDFDKAPADVRTMLQTLVGMGKIDIGVDADAKARAGERNIANRVLYKLQSLNTRIESINRATAAIAAYRGYLQRYGKDKTDAATKFAAETVSNTHGSYDGFNTPRIMQSGTGRVVFQFKRFQIIQLSMLAKLVSNAFGNAPKEEKAVARKMLMFITGQMAAIGGVLAVPFISQIAWLMSKAFGGDEPEDPEVMLRRWIGDQAVADLILRGATGAAGIESLGKKLGMENVASPFGPYAQIDLSSRAGAEKALVAMMGASAGLGLKMADAYGFMTKGDYYRGLEMALPNGLGNAMKGYRMLDEGVTRRNKDVVLKPEEISVVDAAFQAVGLPTTTITRQQFTQRVVAEQNKYYEEKASEIKTNYVTASKDGDTAAMAEARREWEELQASRRAKGYKVQPMSELFQAVSAARKRERSVVGGVETTKSNKRFVEEVSRL